MTLTSEMPHSSGRCCLGGSGDVGVAASAGDSATEVGIASSPLLPIPPACVNNYRHLKPGFEFVKVHF